MEQANIIEKIKKLLNMAARATTHEKEVALFKAQEMMAKYHIEQDDLMTPEERAKVVEITVSDINCKNEIFATLSLVIAQNFRCRHFMRFGGYRGARWLSPVFMGLELDATVAAVIFKDAATYAKKESDRIAHYYYNRTGQCAGVRGEWLTGFVQGLRAGFKAQVQQSSGTALMVIIPPEVNDEYNKIRFSKKEVSSSSASRNFNDALYQAGHQSGFAFSHNRRQEALSSSEE